MEKKLDRYEVIGYLLLLLFVFGVLIILGQEVYNYIVVVQSNDVILGASIILFITIILSVVLTAIALSIRKRLLSEHVERPTNSTECGPSGCDAFQKYRNAYMQLNQKYNTKCQQNSDLHNELVQCQTKLDRTITLLQNSRSNNIELSPVSVSDSSVDSSDPSNW